MPSNNLSLGHDVSVDIYDGASGKVITFPARTMFSADPITKQINSEPLNGPPIFAEAPNGWKGTLEFDRTDSTIDAYFAANEALYFAGGNPLSGSITQTIQEKDGSVTQWRFTGVAMKLDTSGNWKSAEKVTIKVSWSASTRVRVV